MLVVARGAGLPRRLNSYFVVVALFVGVGIAGADALSARGRDMSEVLTTKPAMHGRRLAVRSF
jgi:hypothetical protein